MATTMSSTAVPVEEHPQKIPAQQKNKFDVTSLRTLTRLEECDTKNTNLFIKSPKRKDTPCLDRKYCDYRKFPVQDDGSHSFGTHLGTCKSGNRRSSNYSTTSDFGSWTSEDPCSSAQAEARSAFMREQDSMYSRTNFSDTGYWSQSPNAFKMMVNPLNTGIIKNELSKDLQTDEQKETEDGKQEETEKKNGIRVVPIVKVLEKVSEGPEKIESVKVMQITVGMKKIVPVEEASAEIVDKQIEKEIQKKPKVLRPENMPVDPPYHFAGKLYGYLLESSTTNGTQAFFDEFMRNPDKFFKRINHVPFHKRVMPLLFGKSHKSPADVVKTLREVLIILDKLPPPKIDKDGNLQTDKKYDKALDEVSKNVGMIKSFIYGNDSTDPSGDHVVQVAQLAQEVYNANILPMLVKMLPKFEFECKKDVGQIFNNLLRRQIGTRSPTVEYLGARPEILIQLVQGYSVPDIALTCGLMLRESIRHDHLAKIILQSEVFYTFFTYVQSEVFDIASDAFSTFKELTTRHKATAAEFLDANYDTFFAQYQNLLNSKNYVTRRQSLKLLGELLLDRHNFTIMTKYISNPENLRLMMELLRDKSRNIQYEAFHVFKVFVANPNKPRAISDILNRNREKLVEFLGEFHNDRTDDEQFNDEKAYLIKQIQEMKCSPKEVKKHKKEDEHPGTSEGSSQPAPSEGPSTSQQN